MLFAAPHMAPPSCVAPCSGICSQPLPDVLTHEHAGEVHGSFLQVEAGLRDWVQPPQIGTQPCILSCAEPMRMVSEMTGLNSLLPLLLHTTISADSSGFSCSRRDLVYTNAYVLL